MTAIRRGEERDLAEVAAIQSASPGAAHWVPADYLRYDFRVAIRGNRVAGFIVSRQLAAGEWEVLNLAVTPDSRRAGVGRSLIEALLEAASGTVFLEVRESNRVARQFYISMGFNEINKRENYYETPPEAAIVMKFHSC
jgi:ribosomal-protein-alanine N-acetyltransferase